MEHTEARESYAAERYLLQEMNEAERNGFEEHFFGCIECAADIKAASRFMTAGRAVAQEQGAQVIRPARWNRKWTLPLQAAAMAAAVYVGYLIPRVPTPVPALIPLRAEIVVGPTREEKPQGPIVIEAGEQIQMDVPATYPAYEAEIRDPAGKVLVKSPAYASNDSFYLLPRSLPAGSYSLVIFGVANGNRTEIARQQLRVQ